MLLISHYQNFWLRSFWAFITSLLIILILNPWFIRCLKSYQVRQAVRDDGPQQHLKKTGTPTMGGLLILFSITLATLFWGDLSNRYIGLTLLTTLLYGAIGFIDDFRKVIKRNSKGLPARWKFFWQSVLAYSAPGPIFFFSAPTIVETHLFIPFIKTLLPLSGYFIVVVYFTDNCGSSNAVNLTDGLDGLAIFPVVLVATALGILAYFSGSVTNSGLAMPLIPHTDELMVFCSAMAGAGLGFLWFNAHPAEYLWGMSVRGSVLGVMAITVKVKKLFYLLWAGFLWRKLFRSLCK